MIWRLSAAALLALGVASGATLYAREPFPDVLNAPPLIDEVRGGLLRDYVVPVEDLKAYQPDVDRAAFLAHLVKSVAKGTDEEIAVGWTRWLQDHLGHPKDRPPLDDTGIAIYDPLWLIVNRVGQCGQTNRLIADGLNAVGIKSRVIQLHGHVVAEAWFDGGWHYLDADALDFGQIVRGPDGDIPSVAEIVVDLSLLKSVTPRLEALIYLGIPMDEFRPINAAFQQHDYGDLTSPYVIRKTATAEQERNFYYGWNHYELKPYTD